MHSVSFRLSRTAYVFLGIIAGVFVGTTIRFAMGWNAPQSAPPKQDEIFVPINTGSGQQVKNGDLGLTGNFVVGGNAAITGKLTASSTEEGDSDDTVVTKGYLEDKIGGGVSGAPGSACGGPLEPDGRHGLTMYLNDRVQDTRMCCYVAGNYPGAGVGEGGGNGSQNSLDGSNSFITCLPY